MPNPQKKTEITPTPIDKRTEDHWTKLNQIIDPELNLGIVDLGLIYKVEIDKENTCTIHMTLTTPMCPFGPALIQQVHDKMILSYPELNDVNINLVWKPIWNQDMIDPEIRDLMMGI